MGNRVVSQFEVSIHRQSRWLYGCWPLKGAFSQPSEAKARTKAKASNCCLHCRSTGISRENILPEFSKFYCHPGRAGGTPVGLEGTRSVFCTSFDNEGDEHNAGAEYADDEWRPRRSALRFYKSPKPIHKSHFAANQSEVERNVGHTAILSGFPSACETHPARPAISSYDQTKSKMPAAIAG